MHTRAKKEQHPHLPHASKSFAREFLCFIVGFPQLHLLPRKNATRFVCSSAEGFNAFPRSLQNNTGRFFFGEEISFLEEHEMQPVFELVNRPGGFLFSEGRIQGDAHTSRTHTCTRAHAGAIGTRGPKTTVLMEISIDALASCRTTSTSTLHCAWRKGLTRRASQRGLPPILALVSCVVKFQLYSIESVIVVRWQ